jgi:hypothetical protein
MSTNETRLSNAITQWKRGIFTTKRQCAAVCAVSYNLLIARLSGRTSRHERKPVNKRLTPQEENAVIAFMLRLDTAGIQGNVRTIETCANTLIKSRITGPLETPPQPLGSKWATRFLDAHKDEISLQRDTIKELDRAAAEDPERLRAWYNDLKGKFTRCAIQPQDLYNYDETGFRIGIGKREMVVTKARRKRVRVSSAKDSERELVTACECISASGDVIPPMIILKSKSDRLMEDWVRATDLPDDWLLETSETAYINDEIALEWIKHFDQFSKKRQVGEWRLLLLDGHSSHTTYEFLKFCIDRQILIYFLIPHTSQICQPLDVAVFQPYKHWHGQAIGDLNRLGISNITKVDFLAELPKIREKIFKSGTIKRSFKEAGIWLWNPEVVISKLKIPEKTPEPVILEIPKITPTTIAEMEEIRLHTINGTLLPTFAIKKLANAFIILSS